MISEYIEGKKAEIKEYNDRLANDLILSTKAREVVERDKYFAVHQHEHWETVKLQADNYDINLGHVHATSALDNDAPGSDWKGLLDWALISVPAHKPTQNRVHHLL